MPSLPTIAAPYRGSVTSVSLGEKNDKPQIELRIRLEQIYHAPAGGGEREWMTLEPAQYDWEITAYLYPMRKTESGLDINQTCVDQLKDALGYNPHDGIEAMADPAWVGKLIGLDVKSEEWQGKTQMKVGWLRAADADPNRRIAEAPPEKVSKWAALINHKLASMAPPANATPRPF